MVADLSPARMAGEGDEFTFGLYADGRVALIVKQAGRQVYSVALQPEEARDLGAALIEAAALAGGSEVAH